MGQQLKTPGQPHNLKQVDPTSNTCANLNTSHKTSSKKIKSLKTIVNELNIKKEDLSCFKVNVIYDKMGEIHIYRLDKGLQINLNKKYKFGIKKVDEVMEELIEDVGNNVVTFKYAGNYDQVTKIISSSRGGIILKYERGSLKVFRLCQCRVFVAKYGSQVFQKVPRSTIDSGVDLQVFNFYTFVNRLQNNQVSSHVTTLRFGSSKRDYVEVRVTSMYGPQIKRNLVAKPEDNLESINSITMSIDKISMNALDT